MWIVYILWLSGNGTYYTGITNDLVKRLIAHKSGKGSKYVRSHLPLKIVYQEKCANKSMALKREAAIKRLSHKQKESLVNGTEV